MQGMDKPGSWKIIPVLQLSKKTMAKEMPNQEIPRKRGAISCTTPVWAVLSSTNLKTRL